MALVKCKECGNDVSDQAPTCPKCGAPVPPTASAAKRIAKGVGLGCGGLIGILFLGATIAAIADKKTSPPPPVPAREPAKTLRPDEVPGRSDMDTHPKPDPEPSRPIVCRIAVPGEKGTVPVMPTEEGLDELTKAAVAGDDNGVEVAIEANGGFVVAAGTSCTFLDVGIVQTQVRVTEGPQRGRSGWLPSEWTRGR